MPLLEYFNNGEFLAKELALDIKNPNLIFQSIHLNVRSSLFGLRYLMREYFVTCMLLFTVWIGTMVFVILLLVAYLIKTNVEKLIEVVQTLREVKILDKRQEVAQGQARKKRVSKREVVLEEKK